MFVLGLDKQIWSTLAFKQKDDILPRDDHALCCLDDDSFIVFGGFVKGSRVSELVKFKCSAPNISGEICPIAEGNVAPCVRASISMSCFDSKLWVFGGQDDDNNKRQDLWCFDQKLKTWSQVPVHEGEYLPTARSGHTSVIWGSKMYIFGGIVELTKELNDLVVFDFESM